jgi:hypothetical protein
MTNSEIYNSEQYRVSKSQNLSEFVIFVQLKNIRNLEFKFYTLVDHIIVNI